MDLWKRRCRSKFEEFNIWLAQTSSPVSVGRRTKKKEQWRWDNQAVFSLCFLHEMPKEERYRRMHTVRSALTRKAYLIKKQ